MPARFARSLSTRGRRIATVGLHERRPSRWWIQGLGCRRSPRRADRALMLRVVSASGTSNGGSSGVCVIERGDRPVNHLPIVMEIEVQHYQRERLREAEAERRRARLPKVEDSALKMSNPVVGLTKRIALAFVALLHERAV